VRARASPQLSAARRPRRSSRSRFSFLVSRFGNGPQFWKKRVARLAPVYFFALATFAPLLVAAWHAIDVLPFGQ
jgi:peptidoglycan/LPS O-acetylase OafA/YrhL